MNNTHTPAPWTLQPIGDETECNILGKGRELIATVSDNDAPLMAAAPDLLQALQALLYSALEMEQATTPAGDKLEAVYPQGTLAKARAALAKVKG